jgi:geranylgeranyl reductase family protein
MRVLVVGAGPGGAAAAIELARAGADVLVVERSRWPRAKTCGDGISPPGVREARELGLDLSDRMPLPEGEISTPKGYRFRSGWRPETPWGAIVERIDFDARLMALAVAAGARFETGTTVRSLTPADARARGSRPAARFANGTVSQPEAFDAVVLGEGATGGLGATLGFGRHASRLVALRGYAESERPLDPVFGLYFDRDVSPGYGWVFPLDARRANVGVLTDERAVRRRGGDVRGLLDAWRARSPAARAALGGVPAVSGVKGGVIPTGRARRVRGGVFAIGDAAGVADPFSAEGIHQAMSSGRAAAAALVAHGPGPRAEGAYRRALARFDRNAREARRLRLGFGFVIDGMAARAIDRPALARHFSANGFFMKDSLPAFLWGIARNW